MEPDKLKGLIAEGRSDTVMEALAIFARSLPDPVYNNAVAQLSARWRNNERAHQLGTLSAPEYNLEKNKINQALLELIDELSANPERRGLTRVSPPDSKSRPWKKIAYAVLILGMTGAAVGLSRLFSASGPDDAMQLTVYVQGADHKPVAELQNNGRIIVDFGNDRRAPLIGEDGRTNLGEIPEKFRGEKILITLQAEGYEPVEPGRQFLLDGEPVYLAVRRDNSLGLIQGVVKDRSGEVFLAGALVMIDQDTATMTDSLGRFRLLMPADKQRDTYGLTVRADGYPVKNAYFKPRSGPIEIRMDK